MIEINLDSTNRKNDKIIIDGENICEKYKITGFNLKYEADGMPKLELHICDEDIIVTGDTVNINAIEYNKNLSQQQTEILSNIIDKIMSSEELRKDYKILYGRKSENSPAYLQVKNIVSDDALLTLKMSAV